MSPFLFTVRSTFTPRTWQNLSLFNKNFLVNKIELISSYIHIWSSSFLLANRINNIIYIIKNFFNLWYPCTLPRVKNVLDGHPNKLDGLETKNFEKPPGRASFWCIMCLRSIMIRIWTCFANYDLGLTSKGACLWESSVVWDFIYIVT